MRLTNDYINRISGRPANNHYGVDEFYGRRFIYRTRAGDPLVITVPSAPGLSPYEGGAEIESWDAYPTLRLVCEVLDSLRTRMYEHAVVPVALAHSAAALPLGVGRSVLTMMAQQNIPGLKLDIQAVQPPTYFNKSRPILAPKHSLRPARCEHVPLTSPSASVAASELASRRSFRHRRGQSMPRLAP